MTAFTPGPWHTHDGQVYQDNPAESRRSEDIAYIRGDKDSKEFKANAQAISALPELYSALENALARMDENPPAKAKKGDLDATFRVATFYRDREAARAALRKATQQVDP
jgi:hypothetical protein